MKLALTIGIAGISALALVGLSPKAGAYSEEDLLRLRETGFCERCNLVEADLSDLDLTGARLRGARLTRANLSGATLIGAS